MSVGEQLTAARLRAGLTIEDLSTATRIRPGLLRAIEADDFSRCGGNFYARGHVRAIARVLQLDADPLVAQFDELQAKPEVTLSRRQERAEARLPTVHPARPRWAVVLGAVLVGLLGWGMVRLFTLPRDVEASASKTTPTSQVIPSTPRSTIQPTRAPVTPVKPTSVRVTLIASGGATYVSMRNYNWVQLFQGTLNKGVSQSLANKGMIRVTIGAPRNVKTFVNGKRVYPKAYRFEVALDGTITKLE